MKKAFTLIELLIVVAIIAILAAIAVPNFLEAQVRSKVARARADLRTYGVAFESYQVDNNKYPPGFADPAYYTQNPNRHRCFRHITTPIAYLTSLPTDAFSPSNRPEAKYYYYNELTNPTWRTTPAPVAGGTANSQLAPTVPFVDSSGYKWAQYSSGPRRAEVQPAVELVIAYFNGYTAAPNITRNGVTYTWPNAGLTTIYDPTNGTVSDGRITNSNKGFWDQGGLNIRKDE